MASTPIPEPLRRFILTSVPSVPFVEAMLLFRSNRDAAFDAGYVAKHLYISDAAAADIIGQLAAARIVRADDDPVRGHRYAPDTADLAGHLEALAQWYASHLVTITDMIHSNRARSAQQFADAFKVRKD